MARVVLEDIILSDDDEIDLEKNDPFDDETERERSSQQILKDCLFSRKTLVRIMMLIVVAATVTAAVLLLPVNEYLEAFLVSMDNLGWVGVVIFIGIYILANILFIPCSILNICAGFIWGLWLGFLYIWIGGVLGCLFSFLIGRVAFKYWADFFTSNFKMMAILTRTINRNAWKIMLLLRLSPVMPYNVLNYSLSMVENLSILAYTATAAIGMIPGSALYVYFGTIARDLDTVLSGEASDSYIQQILMGVGLVLTITVVVGVSVVAAREIKTEMKNDQASKKHESDLCESSPLTKRFNA